MDADFLEFVLGIAAWVAVVAAGVTCFMVVKDSEKK
jgi:hypothetical protein